MTINLGLTMMKKTFFSLIFFLFPLLCCQANAAYYTRSSLYNPRVEYKTDYLIVLDNNSVWKILDPHFPSSLKSGSPVIILFNNNDYVVLANRNNPAQFVECALDYLQCGEGVVILQVSHIEYASTEDSILYLTDGSKWRIPSKTSSLIDWKLNDEVLIMPTADQRTYQIINVSLEYRIPGAINYVTAS